MRKVLKRFIDIWKLDFLARFLFYDKNDNKTTVWFWIISNVILVSILLISLSVFLVGVPSKIITVIEKNIPNDASVTIADGQLTTTNINEPFFKEIDISNKKTNYNEKLVIIVDTEEKTYDITSLDDYANGILILRDRAYTKDNDELDQIVFKDVPNISFSREDVVSSVHKYFLYFAILLVIVMACVLSFYFIALRLLSAFWWALMLFIFMRIVDIKESYVVAYKAVLNFYFIPTVIVLAFGLAGFTVPFMTTIIFMVIFIANLVWLRQQHENKNDFKQ